MKQLTCMQCGRQFSISDSKRIYCSDECRVAAREARKKRPAKQWTFRRKPTYSRPPVSTKKCLACIYGGNFGGDTPYCRYYSVTGTTRTFLHPEGLTAECKEYEPKNGRHLRVNFALDGGDTSSIREDIEQEDEDQVYLDRLRQKIAAYGER